MIRIVNITARIVIIFKNCHLRITYQPFHFCLRSNNFCNRIASEHNGKKMQLKKIYRKAISLSLAKIIFGIRDFSITRKQRCLYTCIYIYKQVHLFNVSNETKVQCLKRRWIFLKSVFCIFYETKHSSGTIFYVIINVLN